METVTQTLLQSKLHKVVQFLEPFLPLAGNHLVNFITKQLWETILPNSLREEVSATSNEHLLDLFCSIMTHNLEDESKWDTETEKMCPSIFKFFKNANEMSLKHFSDITLSLETLNKKLNSLCTDEKVNTKGNVFMSPKKLHEVHAMTKVVSTLTRLSRATHVVDVGSGKGYLSSFLALEHGLQVLGIDSSHTNTHGARIRTERMQRFSKKSKDVSCVDKLMKEKNCESDFRYNSEQYKQVTMLVTPQTDITELVKEQFNTAECTSSVSLVGLHTCGDLSPTCLRIFSENSNVSSLCNVGCCYFLLTEEFGTESGFPMSNFLRSINFQLGRNSKMIAVQPLERIVKFKQIPVEALLYRAMLEVILVDKLGNNILWSYVGKLASKSTNFEEYVQNAMKKINTNITISKEEIEAVYNKYIHKKKELQAYFLFRIALSPVIETVILLDRLLYLKEQGIEESYLVSLFDPVISPRCYGIVALKPV